MTVGVLAVLGISGTTMYTYTNSNTKAATRSGLDGVALDLAEAGINNAMSVLLKPGTNALDRYAFCPDTSTTPPLPCWTTSTYDGGTVTWTGTLVASSSSAYWDLTSTSTVRNPSAKKSITRTITARAPVVPIGSQPLNSPAWNYIYSRATGTGVAFSGCDMTLGNSVQVNSPLYVNGNLCMQNTAKIIGGGLFVRGSLTMSQNSNAVGSAAAPIADAHIAKGCKYLSQAARTPCVGGAGGSPTFADNIWANILDSSAGAVEPPVVLYNNWYLNAMPGPYYGCNAPGTGDAANPTFVFDSPVAGPADSDANKLLFKNNNAGLANLTPATSYTCKTLMGELSWRADTKTLTIRGTIYIDGSAKIDNGSVNKYTGQGVIYLSGTFLVKNSKLCARVTSDGNSCTNTNWNPNDDLFTVVADGRGSTGSPDNQVSAADSIQLVSSHIQGALYGTYVVEVGTTSVVDGPLDGSTVILGQSSSSSFPPFTIVPSGMPGNSAVYAIATSPTFFSG